jgi:hypothetical protein
MTTSLERILVTRLNLADKIAADDDAKEESGGKRKVCVPDPSDQPSDYGFRLPNQQNLSGSKGSMKP